MLTSCDLNSLGEYPYVRPTTGALYEGPLTDPEFANALSSLSSVFTADERSICCLFGFGSQTKSTYRQISELDGVEILWDGSFGPGCLTPFLALIASHGGLLQVFGSSSISPAFRILANLAMVEVYRFSVEFRPQLIEYVNENRWMSTPFTIVAKDSAYICFGVDGDSPDSESGIFGWLSRGSSSSASQFAPLLETICN